MVSGRSYGNQSPFGDHMQFLGPLSLLVIACFLLDLLKRFSHLLIGLSVSQCASQLKLLSSGSDGVDGVSAIRCSRWVITAVTLVLIARLGLKALPCGLSSKEIVRFLCELKRKASELGDSDEVSRNRSPKSNESVTGKALLRGIAGEANELVEEDDKGEEDRECSCPEDEAFDVLALRKMVKIERRRAIAASMELEKERIASASAADEAMSLILRLQSEKSSIEMRANQDRRLAEQKQQYDWEVIESLRWMAASHEARQSASEGRLRPCRQRLRMRAGCDGGSRGVEGDSSCFGGGSEESVGNAASTRNEDGDGDGDGEEEEEATSLDDALISSLELDSTIEE